MARNEVFIVSKKLREGQYDRFKGHPLKQQQQTTPSEWPEIALIGSFPPPFGGINVHLQRLIGRMDDEGLKFILFNAVTKSQKPPKVLSIFRHKYRWYLFFLVRHRCKIVHLYNPNWLSRLMLAITARFRPGKYILSIHGRSIAEALDCANPIRSGLTRWFLHQMDMVIACNPEIEQRCLQNVGIAPHKVRMIPAFIPSDTDFSTPPPDYVQSFMEGHSPLIFAVGWIGQRYQGCDVYGLDMLVELIDRLRISYPNIGMAFSVNGGDQEDVSSTIKVCHDRIGEHMLLITEELTDLAIVIQGCDIFVRPTNTDGDAVSIREALHLGTPVIASDAVPRPAPCLLFRNRDMNDFEDKIKKALLNLSRLREDVRSYEMPDNAAKIIQIYKELTEESNNDLEK